MNIWCSFRLLKLEKKILEKKCPKGILWVGKFFLRVTMIISGKFYVDPESKAPLGQMRSKVHLERE